MERKWWHSVSYCTVVREPRGMASDLFKLILYPENLLNLISVMRAGTEVSGLHKNTNTSSAYKVILWHLSVTCKPWIEGAVLMASANGSMASANKHWSKGSTVQAGHWTPHNICSETHQAQATYDFGEISLLVHSYMLILVSGWLHNKNARFYASLADNSFTTTCKP